MGLGRYNSSAIIQSRELVIAHNLNNFEFPLKELEPRESEFVVHSCSSEWCSVYSSLSSESCCSWKRCWTAVKQCDCTVVLTLQCLLWNWYIVLNVQCVCCNFLQESQVILQQILQSCYDSTRKASYYHKFPYRNFRKYSARKAFM